MPPLSLPSRPTSLKNLPYRRVVTRLSTPNVVDCTRRSSYPLKTFFFNVGKLWWIRPQSGRHAIRMESHILQDTDSIYVCCFYLGVCVCVCDHIKKEKKTKSRESSGPMYYPTPDFSGECLDRFLFVPPILLSTVLPSPPVWRVQKLLVPAGCEMWEAFLLWFLLLLCLKFHGQCQVFFSVPHEDAHDALNGFCNWTIFEAVSNANRKRDNLAQQQCLLSNLCKNEETARLLLCPPFLLSYHMMTLWWL